MKHTFCLKEHVKIYKTNKQNLYKYKKVSYFVFVFLLTYQNLI